MGIVCSDDLSKVALLGSPPNALIADVPRGRAPADIVFRAWHAATGVEILTWTYLGRFKQAGTYVEVFYARGTRPMIGEHGEQIEWYLAKDLLPENAEIARPVLCWLVQIVRARLMVGLEVWRQEVGVFEMG